MNRPAPDDDQRTLVGNPSPVAEMPRFVSSSALWGHTLPEGTRVGDVEITGLIGEGGFGIVYLATDHSLQRQVAVKEYMPSSLASRSGEGFTVAVKSERHRETFQAGLKSFVNEARLLARFDHASLVKVYRFWEANGTAYMMMPFYEGPTLKRALADLGAAPDEAQLRSWLRPLLDALEVIHASSCYHRDIAPDNILLTPTGPLLLDFGAARRVIGDMTHALTVVLKPGYAPVEQYGESAKMAQGAWTDLYALACVVYYAITGSAPMTSVERLMDDSLVPLSVQAAGRYGAPFLKAIDAALAVRPQERPQDVWQFRALLNAGASSATQQPATTHGGVGPTMPMTAHAGGVAGAVTHRPTEGLPTRPYTATQQPTVAREAVPTSARDATTVARAPLPSSPAADASSRTVAKPAWSDPEFDQPATRGLGDNRRGMLGWLLGAAGVAALAGTGFVMFGPGRRDAAPAPVRSTPAPVAEPTPAPSPVAAPAPDPAPIDPPVSAPVPVTAPAPAPAPEPAPPPPAAVPAPPPAPVPRAKAPAAAPAPRQRTAPIVNDSSPPPAPAPSMSAARRARCSDILQKASLEPLSAEESSYLKECK